MDVVNPSVQTALREAAAAAAAGGAVRIVYQGGSQPGSAGDVAPLALSAEQMGARDVATGWLTKSYALAKVR